jgi:hypothetical protein
MAIFSKSFHFHDELCISTTPSFFKGLKLHNLHGLEDINGVPIAFPL